MSTIDKLDLQTPNFVNENIEKLAALFPHCVTETAEGKKIDFDLLQQELSNDIVDGNRERYRLEWPGKREAIVTANLPTTKTLRPVREDSVDFDNTENLYIEGDNLEVLKLLQESYFGKVKMIYIDPPYNTGNDFVYKDNFTTDRETELLESGQIDEYGKRMVANPETSGRYHSDWLTMMYPRLKLARNLLTEDGVIFISIDDNEVHNLRKICDEVFGEINFISELVWEKKKKGTFLSNSITNIKEYILVYAKARYQFNGLIGEINSEEETYPCINASNKREIRVIPSGIKSVFKQKNHFLAKGSKISVTTMDIILHSDLVIENGILTKDLTIEGNWRYSQESMTEYANKRELYITQDLYLRRIVKEPRNKTLKDLLPRVGEQEGNSKIINLNNLFENGWGSNEDGEEEIRVILEGKGIIEYPKPIKLILKLIASTRIKDSIILDFFSGSATTAHAVMQLNAEDGGKRKYIMVQLPEQTDEKSEAYKAGYKNICEIGKERIRRAGAKIEEMSQAVSKKGNELAFDEPSTVDCQLSTDIGFRVYRLADSNMQDVYYRPQDYKQNMLDMFADNIKPDRTADDLLAQVMLDWGLPLSYKIEQIDVNGKHVFRVAQDSLLACFDKGIDEAFAKVIAKEKPLRVVFRDSGFASDTAKINVQQLLKQLSPETEMKVI
jgi:adenine-specific DNA-methyltransferase